MAIWAKGATPALGLAVVTELVLVLVLLVVFREVE